MLKCCHIDIENRCEVDMCHFFTCLGQRQPDSCEEVGMQIEEEKQPVGMFPLRCLEWINLSNYLSLSRHVVYRAKHTDHAHRPITFAHTPQPYPYPTSSRAHCLLVIVTVLLTPSLLLCHQHRLLVYFSVLTFNECE